MKSLKGFSRKKNKQNISGYTYTNTRVKVLKSKLLKREDYQKFLKMSEAEIARYMQETEYKKEITDLAVKFSGANLIEYGMSRNLENTLARMLNFALRGAKDQIRLYLRRYDIGSIKTILRGKFSKMSDETIKNELVTGGELSQEFLDSVVEKSKSLEEAIEQFKGTDYYPILKNFSSDLTKLEDELERFYYQHVLGNAEKELEEYIRLEIFVKNTLNRLRARKANIKADIIPGEKRVKVPHTEDSIEARVFMKKLLIGKAVKMVREVKRNIKPMLGYIVAKENEVSNIRILTRGRHAGLSEDLIQKQLVI